MQAQYPLKVQAIRSKGRTDRYYVFVPLPLAAAIGLEGGEKVQWSLTDRNTLTMQRVDPSSSGAPREGAAKKTSRPKKR